MNISLKPHQLVVHWVPGFILLMLVPVLKPDWYSQVKTLLPCDQVSRGFIWIVLPFVAGQLIDCIRNALFEKLMEVDDQPEGKSIEHSQNGLFTRLSVWWRKWKTNRKVNWDYFFRGEAQRLENLDRWFFEYYAFDLNLAVPSICFFVCRLFQCRWGQCFAGLAVSGLLIYDALSLRKEIADHTKTGTSVENTEGDSSKG